MSKQQFTILFIAVVVIASIAAYFLVNKSTPEASRNPLPASVSASQFDSVVVRGTKVIDTVKIVAIDFESSNYVRPIKGYAVVTALTGQDGSRLPINEVLFTQEWDTLQRKGLYDVRKLDW